MQQAQIVKDTLAITHAHNNSCINLVAELGTRITEEVDRDSLTGDK